MIVGLDIRNGVGDDRAFGRHERDDLAEGFDDGGKILIQHSSGNTKVTLLASDIKIESSGDTIVDGGNSYYRDDVDRAREGGASMSDAKAALRGFASTGCPASSSCALSIAKSFEEM